MKEKIDRLSLKKRDPFVHPLERKEIVLEQLPDLYRDYLVAFEAIFAKEGKTFPKVGEKVGVIIPEKNLYIEMITVSEERDHVPERQLTILDIKNVTFVRISDYINRRDKESIAKDERRYEIRVQHTRRRKQLENINDSVALLAAKERLFDLKEAIA